MNLDKGTRLGAHELVLRIGRGGMASVWLAREHAQNPANDRLVAVKAMLPDLAGEREFVRMFIDEVRLARVIRHPNVVDVYDVGEQDGIMWMAMEWVEGESLHGLIAEAGKRHAIPIEIAVRIIADAAAGLHAAHEICDENGDSRNLVHRDVSPHNILIGTTGQVKLVDFGVAKAIDRIGEKTRTGHLKGKFGYMSPEQVLGASVDRRSDIFALGIVLYELTTNRRLFRGSSDVHTLQLVTSGQIPRPSLVDATYPRRLEEIVMTALERNLERRHPTAADLEADLRRYLKTECILVPRSGVAGLLKRVVGPRIEQRRSLARQALKGAERSEAMTEPELISEDPAFTPTGNRDRELEAQSHTGQSSVTSLSQVSPLTRSYRAEADAARTSGFWRGLLMIMLTLAAASSYFVYQSRLKGVLFRHKPPAPSAPAIPRSPDPRPVPSPADSSPAAPASRASEIPVVKVEDLTMESEPAEQATPSRKPIH